MYRALGAFRSALIAFTHANGQLLQRAGLTPQQFALLVLIGGSENGAVSVGEAADALHIAHNSAVGLSQRTHKAGFVSRAPDPQRGQRTLLRLTEAGEHTLARITGVLIAELAHERVALIETLTRWNALLSPREQEGPGPADAQVVRAGAREKPVLRNLLQLHLHELSLPLGARPDDQGHYPYPDFDAYWSVSSRQDARPTDGAHTPYLLRLARHPAGFALVDRQTAEDRTWHVIRELHVLHPYRGRGLGTHLVGALLRGRRGIWRVAFPARSVSGRRFWQRVLPRFASGPLQDLSEDSATRGLIQLVVDR